MPIGNLRTEGDLARFIDAETALTLAEGVGGGTPGGGEPSGPAGGALAGWYPDPDLNSAIAGAGLSFDSNVLSVDGSSGVLTTKGDLLSHNGSEARLPVGQNTQVLTADATQALGIKWADPSGGDPGPNAAYSETIGDGSETTFSVEHSLHTRDVAVVVREADSPYEGVVVDWAATTTNTVEVSFLVAPASNSMRVTIFADGDPSGGGGGPERVTELPDDPSDGDEVYYAVDPGYWHLTYVDADERWNFVGGPPLFGADEANRDIGGGGGYNEWKIVPPGCAVEIPLFGEYLCAHDGEYKFGQGEAAYQIMMSYANTVRFSVGQETRAEKPALGEAVTMEGKGLRELLPGEDVFLMQYVSNDPQNTWGNIRNRSITARPNWVMKEVPDGWVQGQLRDLALKKVEEANPVLKI